MSYLTSEDDNIIYLSLFNVWRDIEAWVMRPIIYALLAQNKCESLIITLWYHALPSIEFTYLQPNPILAHISLIVTMCTTLSIAIFPPTFLECRDLLLTFTCITWKHYIFSLIGYIYLTFYGDNEIHLSQGSHFLTLFIRSLKTHKQTKREIYT